MKTIVLAFCLFAVTYAVTADVEVDDPQSTGRRVIGTYTCPPCVEGYTRHFDSRISGSGSDASIQPPVGGIGRLGGIGGINGGAGGIFGVGDIKNPQGTGLGFDASNVGKGPLIGAEGSVGTSGYSKSVTVGGVKLTEQAHIPGMEGIGGFKGISTDIGIGGKSNPSAGSNGLGVGLPFGKGNGQGIGFGK